MINPSQKPPPSPRDKGDGATLESSVGFFTHTENILFKKKPPNCSKSKQLKKFFAKLKTISDNSPSNQQSKTLNIAETAERNSLLSSTGFAEISLKSPAGHTDNIRSLDWAPDPSTWWSNSSLFPSSSPSSSSSVELATGSADKSIMIWNFADGGWSSGDYRKPTQTFRQHTDIVERVCYEPFNPNVIASGSRDHTVKIWDKRCGKFNSFKTNTDVLNLCFNSDGSILVAGTKTDDLYFFDLRGTNKAKSVTQKALAPQDRKRYYEMFFYSPKIQKINSNETFDEQTDFDQNNIEDDEVLILATSAGDALFFEQHCALHCANSIYGMDIDPFGKTIACCSVDSILSFWSLETLICEKSLPISNRGLRGLSYFHDGNFIAAAQMGDTIDIIHTPTGEIVYEIVAGKGQEVLSVKAHPSKYMLAYAASEKSDNFSIQVIKFMN